MINDYFDISIEGCLNTDIKNRNCIYFEYYQTNDDGGYRWFEWYSNYDWIPFRTEDKVKIQQILEGISKFGKENECNPNKSVEITSIDIC